MPFGSGGSGFLSSGAVLKAIQTGSIDLNGAVSATATISAIVTGNSILFYNGYATASVANQPDIAMSKIVQTNSTTVTASRTTSAANAQPVKFGVAEFTGGLIKSVQNYTIANTGATTTVTATISSVTVAKTILSYLGMSTSDASFVSTIEGVHHVLTNATTVTGTTGGNPGGATVTTSGQAVEFN